MFNKSLLVLLVLGFTAVAGHFTKGGSCEQDEKDRFDSCKPLVSHDGCNCGSNSDSDSNEGGDGDGEISGSGSGSGNSSGSWEISGSGSGSGSGWDGEWGDGDYCYLLQIFLEFSLTLDIDIKIIFIEWINITQTTIVEDASLTEYEILVKIWYSLQILFQEYQEIEIAIKFLYIGDWGYVCDLEGLALDIQTSTTTVTIQEVITISGGSCPLFDALTECGQNGTSSEQAAIQVLITELTVIIEGYYSFSETLVLIWEKFEVFLAQYPDIAVLIYSGEIEGFGILQSFIDLCNVYWRIENFSVAVGGTASGSTSDCELLKSLDDLWKNTSFSNSQRQDFKQLYNKTFTYFSVEVSIELRVQYFVEQLYQLLILAEWDIAAIYSVEIKGYGSIYDLIYAYIYCVNNGVTPGDFTVSAEPSTSTTTTPSTTTPTTTTTTTTAPSTTKAPNCTNAWTVNVYNQPTSGYTLLISSIEKDQATWTLSMNNTFLGYKKKILAISANTTTGYSQSVKFSEIKQILLNFAGSTTTVYQRVQAVYISTWGYVSSYCACSSSGSTSA